MLWNICASEIYRIIATRGFRKAHGKVERQCKKFDYLAETIRHTDGDKIECTVQDCGRGMSVGGNFHETSYVDDDGETRTREIREAEMQKIVENLLLGENLFMTKMAT